MLVNFHESAEVAHIVVNLIIFLGEVQQGGEEGGGQLPKFEDGLDGGGLEFRDVNFGETVEETAGKSLAALAEGDGVLVGEDFEVGVFVEGGVHFGDEDLAAVVQNGVEAFQDTLAGQVEFI